MRLTNAVLTYVKDFKKNFMISIFNIVIWLPCG
jgi:sphinganine-1-phosphate aldolase